MDKKKLIKNLPLFIIEIILLVAAIAVLYMTLRVTGEDGIEKVKLNEDKIEVNEEVKEEVQAATEDKVENKYTGVYNIAFFGVE